MATAAARGRSRRSAAQRVELVGIEQAEALVGLDRDREEQRRDRRADDDVGERQRLDHRVDGPGPRRRSTNPGGAPSACSRSRGAGGRSRTGRPTRQMIRWIRFRLVRRRDGRRAAPRRPPRTGGSHQCRSSFAGAGRAAPRASARGTRRACSTRPPVTARPTGALPQGDRCPPRGARRSSPGAGSSRGTPSAQMHPPSPISANEPAPIASASSTSDIGPTRRAPCTRRPGRPAAGRRPRPRRPGNPHRG